jgi:ribonuclease BN (tRNA processing enzyme)
MPELSIHVLGSGIGESIIVHLPNGKWGVVDCYASNLSDSSSNQTLSFLLEQGASELEFLCLTHPHFDHYRGLSQLLDAFRVRYFWRFGAFGPHDLKSVLLRYMKLSARKPKWDDLLENAAELSHFLAEIFRKRAAGDIEDIFLLSDLKPLYPIPLGSDSDLEIESIAPSSNNPAIAHRHRRPAGNVVPRDSLAAPGRKMGRNSHPAGSFRRLWQRCRDHGHGDVRLQCRSGPHRGC